VTEEQSGVTGLVEHLFRSRAAQIVAYLARLFGPEHLDLAEEVVQEALVRALQQWPYSGVPANPGGWLFRVAKNAALDALRRHAVFHEKAGAIAEALRSAAGEAREPEVDAELRDAELALIFMCCHPALPRESRIALSLKVGCGFGVAEIARAFLAEESAVAQRLVRAKRQIRELGLRLELPGRDELAPRLDSVLEVVYLLFNEGYAAHAGDALVRPDLCAEALRLGRLVADSPLGAPRAHALVALMAFLAARLPARVDARGELVLLEEQDRRLWDERLVAVGFRRLERSAEGPAMSPYHLEAAIAAVHARATGPADTDWAAILELYDQLLALKPSPVVALNRAVALAKVRGADAGLAALQAIEGEPALRGYHLLPAARARLLEEAGQFAAAAACYREALACRASEPERRLLRRRLAECERRTEPAGARAGRRVPGRTARPRRSAPLRAS
jgi:RNA polymerase sigma-70 factor (ECF subfamily)